MQLGKHIYTDLKCLIEEDVCELPKLGGAKCGILHNHQCGDEDKQEIK